ncbi:MAG: TonB-dependent receptor [Planctomycetota bacterium]
MLRSLTLIACISICFSVLSLSAQTEPDAQPAAEPIITEPPVEPLVSEPPVIVVTATRTKADISEVSGGLDIIRSEALDGPSFGLEAALSELPGVNVTDGGFPTTKPGVSMRGQPGRYGMQRTLMLIDGSPINDAYLGDVDLRLIAGAGIEQVEVLRGPGASLYGDAALGGVINVMTRRAEAGQAGFNVSQFAGSYNTILSRMSHIGRNGAFDYNFRASNLQTDGYYENSDGSLQDWRALSVGGLIGYEPSSRSDATLAIDATTASGDQGYYLQSVQSVSARAALDWEYGKDNLVSARLYHNAYDNTLDWKHTNAETHDLSTVGLSIQNDMWLGRSHRLSFGVDVKTDAIDIRSPALNPSAYETIDETISGYAARIQDEIAVGERVHLQIGARVDYDDDYGAEVSPRIGAAYELKNGGKLYASAGKGYLAPTVSDLRLPVTAYGMNLSGSIVTFQGNEDLEPETHWSAEIGGTHPFELFGIRSGNSRRKSEVRWAAFTDFGENAVDHIYFMSLPPAGFMPGFQMMRAENVAATLAVGAEFGVTLALPKGFDVRGSYCFVSNTVEEYEPNPGIEGNWVEELPQHLGFAAIRYSVDNGLTAEVSARFSGKRYTDAENIGELPGFAVMALSVRYEALDGLFVTLRFDNLLDKSYAESTFQAPPPGRTVMGGIEARF